MFHVILRNTVPPVAAPPAAASAAGGPPAAAVAVACATLAGPLRGKASTAQPWVGPCMGSWVGPLEVP